MISVPCAATQVFWCQAVPNDPRLRAHQGTVQEIVLAQEAQDACAHMEQFWDARVSLVLHQAQVQELLERCVRTVAPGARRRRLDALWEWLRGTAAGPSWQSARVQGFYVYGTDAQSRLVDGVFACAQEHHARERALQLALGFSTQGVISIRELQRLYTRMHAVRTGQLGATQAPARTDRLDARMWALWQQHRAVRCAAG